MKEPCRYRGGMTLYKAGKCKASTSSLSNISFGRSLEASSRLDGWQWHLFVSIGVWLTVRPGTGQWMNASWLKTALRLWPNLRATDEKVTGSLLAWDESRPHQATVLHWPCRPFSFLFRISLPSSFFHIILDVASAVSMKQFTARLERRSWSYLLSVL